MSENTVVLSYEANDEDTETVTVAFTASETEGNYQLDGEQSGDLNQQRGDGAERGQKLGRGVVDGEQWRSGEDDDGERVEPERDVVRRRSDVDVRDASADRGRMVSENTVVLSYEANDEDTETVTVAFTDFYTNTEGYYQADTENNQVTLTERGDGAERGQKLGRGVVNGEQWRSGEDDDRERGAERDVRGRRRRR